MSSVQPVTYVSGLDTGHALGLKQVSEETWLVTFIDYDLGYFDTESSNFKTLPNPFGPKVLPLEV